MDERYFKEKLTAAMAEPKAPETLIRRTVVRVNAVREGMAAEETLLRQGSALAAADRGILAARSVVGRLMQSVSPPDGVSGEMMAQQLMEKPAFRKLADLPADRLLDDLRHGRVNKALSASAGSAGKSAPAPHTEPGPKRNDGPKL